VNIVVCVKQTPLATAEKTVMDDGRLDREDTDNAINGYDEVAVEEALRVQEKHGGEVTVLTMGPKDATEAVRKALAMGADKAVMVTDDALEGSDVWVTAHVLAAAIRRLNPDLVLMGMQSDDAATGVAHHGVAEYAGLPALTHTAQLTVEGDTVTTRRRREDGYATLQAKLPALVGVIDVINQPRYPSMKTHGDPLGRGPRPRRGRRGPAGLQDARGQRRRASGPRLRRGLRRQGRRSGAHHRVLDRTEGALIWRRPTTSSCSASRTTARPAA